MQSKKTVCMKQFDPKQLVFFTGTTVYHLHAPRVVLTDGAKYVAEHAEAYWLMDAIASYLPPLVNRESHSDYGNGKVNLVCLLIVLSWV